MPLHASGDVLVNSTAIDSGTTVGSGTDPAVGAGAIVSVNERSEIGLLFIIKESDTSGEPGDADTLSIKVEVSVDGGSTYPDVTTSRSVVGTEAPDQEDDGDPSVKLAIIMTTPKADAAQAGVIKIRLTLTASDGSNWGLWGAIMPTQSLRREWLENFYDLAA